MLKCKIFVVPFTYKQAGTCFPITTATNIALLFRVVWKFFPSGQNLPRYLPKVPLGMYHYYTIYHHNILLWNSHKIIIGDWSGISKFVWRQKKKKRYNWLHYGIRTNAGVAWKATPNSDIWRPFDWRRFPGILFDCLNYLESLCYVVFVIWFSVLTEKWILC